MEKMKMESVNGVQNNIEKIAELFPNCVTETLDNERSTPENPVYKKAINLKMLNQMLADQVIEGDEAYEMTWVGKKAAIVEANKPIRKTLRPCPKESVNWDTTENLYIEGDNLEALKLLQESYLGKVKLIYIDPPYNTGSDLLYKDEFRKSSKEYEVTSHKTIENNEIRLFKNTDNNGRFHSDWCSFIYPRLLMARNLLTENGVIFISIDDHEQQNMKNICDEIFGSKNFIAQIIWERAFAPINLMKHFSPAHDYILCYAKNIDLAECYGVPRSDEANSRYTNPDNDPRGVWSSSDISVGPAVEANIYPIITPSGRIVEPPSGRSWRLSEKAFKERCADKRIWFGPDGDGVPRIKRFLSELRKTGITPTTIWKYTDVGHSQDATKYLTKLFDGQKVFDYPKPVKLIQRCIELYSKNDDIILDFFSGSATTAEAVFMANNGDKASRRFILVQLPEPFNRKVNTIKPEFKTICDLGKDRIIRSSQLIKENKLSTNIDFGFRTFKVDESNMNDVYFQPSLLSQSILVELESNIKEDRSDLDLFFGCILDWGLPLSLPYSTEVIGGFKVHNYNDGDLVACFDENVSEELVREIASRKPMRAVFRDSSFQDSPEKINVFEIFKKFMPEDADDITKRVKVI